VCYKYYYFSYNSKCLYKNIIIYAKNIIIFIITQSIDIKNIIIYVIIILEIFNIIIYVINIIIFIIINIINIKKILLILKNIFYIINFCSIFIKTKNKPGALVINYRSLVILFF